MSVTIKEQEELDQLEILKECLVSIEMILVHMSNPVTDYKEKQLQARDGIRFHLQKIRELYGLPLKPIKQRYKNGTCILCGKSESKEKKKSNSEYRDDGMLVKRRNMNVCPYCGEITRSCKEIGEKCDNLTCMGYVKSYFGRPTWDR